MSRFSSLDRRKGTHLPEEYWPSHELCFKVHDVMTQLLAPGERARAFYVSVDLPDEAAKREFENASDIFEWLEKHRTPEDRVAALVTTMFPAILSDMLHCFYEALETSRKAKLGISFMLLRKPLQESLYVLEAVIADRTEFAQKLTEDPIKLWSQGIGGREAHTRNIQKVLEAVGESDRFDPAYLAQLSVRQERAEDGFDGICNKAMHLFTGHKSIKTERMNINFIFSNWDSKLTQWSYIYSRLPYLLVYMHFIVEHVCEGIAPTSPAYLDDMKRRISALVLLWWETIDDPYIEPHLETFAERTRDWLCRHCNEAGFSLPTKADLIRMGADGAFPGETRASVVKRLDQFKRSAAASGSYAPTPLARLRLWFNKKLGH
jgi:hypothetical protein